ncbi:metallophosphoesterase family protein [Flavivirga jejuensis]|uniref:Metallophosphoesterase n=1 Tax=Flavivirga jejuensis TaxID=870487 RepID=A0ABT8WKE0_9FLAO|nr:metallophosphoesterase [Flavivirga jejuensis]MDO5973436.1 metallophosphoesterase [Flavivirga jejuensis]
MQVLKNLIFIFLLFALTKCKTEQNLQPKNVQMAFLADVHFQDIYAEFKDANYKGIKNPISDEFVNIRTMGSQLKSTRIFNENYFAFLAALDDISKRGIKIVVLPGDFSDDGQPIHVKGLRRILDNYSEKYGISFFATTGNHDPVRPFSREAIKKDFLGEGGKEQIIASSESKLKIVEDDQLKPIITSGIKNWGYQEILNEMSDFGFYPKQDYLYWETPFSNYNYTNYNFKKASEASPLEKRVYPIQHNTAFLPDASYLVEPIKDVWLLAIDANVYIPKEKTLDLESSQDDYTGASIGFNNVLSHKNHLVDWVERVSKNAKAHGKTLIAFSHYPMVDFNDDASSEMKTFFGSNKMQLHRVPNEDVAKTFANAGIQIHFGGHMHINDTGVRTTAKGTLFNIQTPSLAAYIPAYKILTIHSDSEFDIETVVTDSVHNFNKLFSLYEQEHTHLESIKKINIWNKDILKTKNYREFTQWHLKELTRLRFIPKDWPKTFTDAVLKSSGKDLLLMAQDNKQVINQQLASKKWSLNDFESWTGFDMIFDFYRLRSADELALADIGLKRLEHYQFVCDQLSKSGNKAFALWQSILKKTANGYPSNHFKINLKTSTIERINP